MVQKEGVHSTSQEAQGAHKSVRKAMRWVWALFGSGTIFLVVALIFLLAQATSNQDLYTEYFNWLVGVNIAIAALMLIALVWAAVRLVVRLRRGRFGSRLVLKLALIFSVVGILPGLLVYAVSYQFVSRSIETWFDVKVEGALQAGLNLGRVSFDAQVRDFVQSTVDVANELKNKSESEVITQIDGLRQRLRARDVMLQVLNGRVLAASGSSSYSLSPPIMAPFDRARLLNSELDALYEIVEHEDGGPPQILVIAKVPFNMYNPAGDVRVLRVTASMPAELVANAKLVEEANKEYQERALGRVGLRRMYIGTLTLALCLAVFGAVILAVFLGQQLLRPLLVLAEGVKQVGLGDLSPKQLVHTRDELGGLTHAFAGMTNQLREAQEVATLSLNQVADARAHLQTVLDNLTTGVIELDGSGVILSINPGAQRILRKKLLPNLGIKLESEITLREFGQRAQKLFAAMPVSQSAHWQETFELEDLDLGDTITIVARGAWLSETMRLLVIDDISDIISAQRSVAWGEVAQRLAHEIKNPLTPIQLSAERIEHKFSSKLEEADRAVLQRSVKMIVDQVDAMKRLVNEFREYARLPVAELKPLDLNALVRDIIQLYVGDRQRNLELHLKVDLQEDLPLIKGDAAQLRQVLHNLLQNALDTVEGLPEQNIAIVTQYECMPESAQTGGRVCLLVCDSGIGFPDKILKRAFEPYVTTKDKGTGLGLAVVKKIMDEHNARIDLSNQIDDQGNVIGAQVLLSFPVFMPVEIVTS